MPRLRRRNEHPAEVPQVEWVIATENFRPQQVAPLVSKGQKLRITEPVVHQCPQFFEALVQLTPELLAGGKR